MKHNNDWWRGAVIYQIYPRSFQDSNSDGVGDLNGITQRLDYIADLGVDAIWLSPIFTSPMKDFGYDISNYRDIDPVFGTLSDFDALLKKAHRLKLKVMIDQVLSHSSDRHPFFQESRQSKTNPKADWYVWADPKHDGTAPNNWQAIFGGIAWDWEPRRRQYYFHNFLKEQPDFNFHNQEVQEWSLDNMKFWLERGVDGFRLDTVNFYFHDRLLRDDAADFRRHDTIPSTPYDMQYHLFSKNQPENLEFLQKMRNLLDNYDTGTLVGEVGEIHHQIEIMAEYTRDQRLHMAYSFALLESDFGAQFFRDQVELFFRLAPQGWPCWAFSNHDVMRHCTRWSSHAENSECLAKQTAVLLLSLPGSVCMYQGEELGQLQTDLEYHELTDPQGIAFWPANKGRDGCRTPMVWSKEQINSGFSGSKTTWLPIKHPQSERAVDTQIHDKFSVLNFYKKMLKIRREHSEFYHAEINFSGTQEPVLCFTRGEHIHCFFNLSPVPCVINRQIEGKILIGQGYKFENNTSILDANGFLICKQ